MPARGNAACRDAAATQRSIARLALCWVCAQASPASVPELGARSAPVGAVGAFAVGRGSVGRAPDWGGERTGLRSRGTGVRPAGGRERRRGCGSWRLRGQRRRGLGRSVRQWFGRRPERQGGLRGRSLRRSRVRGCSASGLDGPRRAIYRNRRQRTGVPRWAGLGIRGQDGPVVPRGNLQRM